MSTPMYVQTWNKYLSVLRILVKRADTEPQTFRLNTPDFDKAGPSKKSNFKFSVYFRKGRAEQVTGHKTMANDLATVLLQDDTIRELFLLHEYQVNMDSKFQLVISQAVKAAPAPVASALDDDTVSE